ncbi:hypothetical protein AA0482_1522 [Acetobacter cibinongensis NRIC 0482]|nr:hypothetical protein AA0482_1522 [Acetobacter cibinongensis NRIC 0482]
MRDGGGAEFDKGPVLFNPDRAQNFHKLAWCVLRLAACTIYQKNEVRCRTVKHRNFRPIDQNKGIVYAATVESSHKMFDSGNAVLRVAGVAQNRAQARINHRVETGWKGWST